jgi:hypothetical protein
MTLGLIVVCLIGVIGVWPLSKQRELNSTISSLQHTHASQLQIIANKEMFEEQFEALSQRSTDQGRLLRGASRQQAEIDAQARIRNTLERLNVKLLQTQSKLANTEDGFVEIVTSVQLECQHAQLNDILYEIEFGPTQFTIDRMDIRKQRVRRSAADRDRNRQSQASQLRVSLDIKGFWRADVQD